MVKIKEKNLRELDLRSISNVRSNLSQLVEKASQGDKTLITVNGEPKAIIMDFSEYREIMEIIDLLEDKYLEEKTKERIRSSTGKSRSLEEIEE